MLRPNYNLETVVDQNGLWSVDIANDLAPGIHTAHIEDVESGDFIVGLIEVIEDVEGNKFDQLQQHDIQKTDVSIPVPWYWYVLPIVLLVFFLISLRKKKSSQQAEVQAKKRGKLIPTILFILFLLSAWYVWHLRAQTDTFNKFPDQIAVDREFQNISGTVLTLSDQPIPGLQLKVPTGESVTTSEDGTFKFTGLSLDVDGVDVSTPGLRRTVTKGVEMVNNMIFYYDETLFNTMVEIVDHEAASRADALLSYMPPQVRDTYSGRNMIDELRSVHTVLDRTDQKLVITAVNKLDEWFSRAENGKVYRNVVEVILANDGDGAVYYFTGTPGNWQLMQLPIPIMQSRIKYVQ